MSPTRFLQEFDSYEITEQGAYDRIDPLPDPWYQMGLTLSWQTKLAGVKKDLPPETWIPAKKVTKRDTPEELKAKVEGLRKYLKDHKRK